MPNYQRMTRRAARRYGLDPHVFVNQIRQESNFDPRARSGAGARGIAQIMPATAEGWGVDPDNPHEALDAAAKNMARYVHQFGSYEKALRAYNAGPGAVEKSRSFGETNAYVANILGGRTPSPAGARARARGSTTTTKVTTTTPGVDNRAARAALISSFLSEKDGDPLQFALRARDLRDVAPTRSTRSATRRTAGAATAGSGGGSAGASIADFEGKKVAGWIAPILTYARQQGWKGTINSGYRSDAEQTAIYNSGVRPAAVPRSLGGKGSNHEFKGFPGGAVDVSDAAQLSAILRRSKYGRKLVWAGGKDPVHFSHPHGGSY